MEYQEDQFSSRSIKLFLFGEGEWIDELDVAEFDHLGYKCRVERGQFGSLCGYIYIPKDHPWHGKDYDDLDVQVHGGLTYAEYEDDLFLIGYDCSHSRDIIPCQEKLMKCTRKIKKRVQDIRQQQARRIKIDRKFPDLLEKTYKNMAFCIEECKSLAQQAHDAAKEVLR